MVISVLFPLSFLVKKNNLFPLDERIVFVRWFWLKRFDSHDLVAAFPGSEEQGNCGWRILGKRSRRNDTVQYGVFSKERSPHSDAIQRIQRILVFLFSGSVTFRKDDAKLFF